MRSRGEAGDQGLSDGYDRGETEDLHRWQASNNTLADEGQYLRGRKQDLSDGCKSERN